MKANKIGFNAKKLNNYFHSKPTLSLKSQETYSSFLSDKDSAFDTMDYLDQLTEQKPSSCSRSPKGKYITANILLFSCRSDDSTTNLKEDIFI